MRIQYADKVCPLLKNLVAIHWVILINDDYFLYFVLFFIIFYLNLNNWHKCDTYFNCNAKINVQCPETHKKFISLDKYRATHNVILDSKVCK